MTRTRYSVGWGCGFRDTLRDELVRVWNDHYGLNPEHPGQFFNEEEGRWVDIPLTFPPIYADETR